MFESFSEKKLEQAISEFRKLQWDNQYYFEMETLTQLELETLSHIYQHRAEFIERGEAWLERTYLVYN